MASGALTIPRRPVFGWHALRGARIASLPCMLDQPRRLLTSSGRAAILLALESLSIVEGDRVLVPSYHCPTMITPIAGLNALPVFYPIDGNGGPLLTWLEAADLRGVRAILLAHFFGLPQPLAAWRRWCDLRGIAIVEDCAHALFGRSDGEPVGHWGDVAIASLPKFLPVDEGGCALFNRTQMPTLMPAGSRIALRSFVAVVESGARYGRLGVVGRPILSLARMLRALRPQGTAKPVGPAARASQDDEQTLDVASAHRGPAAPCRWLAEWTPREQCVVRRRRHYNALAAAFGGLAGMHPLRPVLPPDAAPYVFPLWVQEPDPGYRELRRLGVPVLRWDRPWPGVPQMDGDHGPAWSHHVLQLPCHQDLSDIDCAVVVDTVKRVFGAAPAAVDRAGLQRSSA